MVSIGRTCYGFVLDPVTNCYIMRKLQSMMLFYLIKNSNINEKYVFYKQLKREA